MAENEQTDVRSHSRLQARSLPVTTFSLIAKPKKDQANRLHILYFTPWTTQKTAPIYYGGQGSHSAFLTRIDKSGRQKTIQISLFTVQDIFLYISMAFSIANSFHDYF